MRNFSVIAIVILTALFVEPAAAAINFDGVGPLNFSTSNLDLDFSENIGNLSLKDAISQPASAQQALAALKSIGSFFTGINDWLETNAGIHVIPILKNIGSLFVYVVEKMIDLIKFGLDKI